MTSATIQLSTNNQGKTAGHSFTRLRFQETSQTPLVSLVDDESAKQAVYAKTFLSGEETFEALSPPGSSVKQAFSDTVCGNGFISTLHKAFADEMPIALQPSHIWTLILQAVSIHVNENEAAMRSTFVDHDGKKKLIVFMDHLSTSGQNSAEDWIVAFPEFVENLTKSVKDASLVPLMNNAFASSGEVERVGFTIAMMHSMKNFFEYRCITRCGITAVHLLGELSEWVELRQRAEQLCAKLDLGWWSVELLPVLDQFVALANGDTSQSVFWEHMYRDLSLSGSGEEYSGTGWINVFFPYVANRGGSSYRRRALDWKNEEARPDADLAQFARLLYRPEFLENKNRPLGKFLVHSHIAYHDYPSGANKCPFVWEITQTNTSHDMRFCGGFLTCVGVVERDGVQTCTPAQGWAVVYHEKNFDDEGAMHRKDSPNTE